MRTERGGCNKCNRYPPPSIELTEGQEVTSLTAKVLPETAVAQVSWSSSDAGVASVNQNGGVTPIKAGTATITATAGGKSGTCQVTVKAKPIEPIKATSVSISPSTISVKEMATLQLTATVLPADAADKEVEWGIVNSDIATIDKTSGLLTGVKAGTTKVSVRLKNNTGITSTCDVTVIADKSVKSIKLSAEELFVKVSKTAQLTVYFTPEDADNKEVTWSSDKASVAKVENGKVTGVAVGTATITATSKDGGHKASCKVTVTADEPDLYVSTNSFLLKNGEKIYDILNESAIDHSNGDIYYLSGYYIYKNGAKIWHNSSGLLVYKLLVSSGKAYCVTRTSDWKYSLYNANTGEKITDIGTDLSDGYFGAANISPDGKKIGVVLSGKNAFEENVGLVSIYDIESGSLKETIMEEKDPNVGRGCAFDNDGNFYYAAETPYINGEWAYYYLNIHKNNQVLYTIKQSDYKFDANMNVPIVASGKDIYFAFLYGNDKNTIGVFKNGSHQYDINVSQYDRPQAIRISSKGNLYVGGYKEIFRDGKNVYTLEIQNENIGDFDLYE